ncbi:MAG: hypothetical protein L3V56_10630 [Candidatus Magnetoovum sp. WYHC-5]|nr:hypothetical protein [Candidatus Magnetoovum sp. WYHC-5]
MKQSDKYHKWVQWSEEDQTYIGKCPALITGIHGDDPVELYSELCEVVEEVIKHFESARRMLPVSPMCLIENEDEEMPPDESFKPEFIQKIEERIKEHKAGLYN